MTDKDLLTMLTSEDSARIAEAILESQREITKSSQMETAMRMQDHKAWKQRQDEKHESHLQLEQHYRWHVIGASILNMVSTAAIVVLVLKVVTVL